MQSVVRSQLLSGQQVLRSSYESVMVFMIETSGENDRTVCMLRYTEPEARLTILDPGSLFAN